MRLVAYGAHTVQKSAAKANRQKPIQHIGSDGADGEWFVSGSLPCIHRGTWVAFPQSPKRGSSWLRLKRGIERRLFRNTCTPQNRSAMITRAGSRQLCLAGRRTSRPSTRRRLGGIIVLRSRSRGAP
jgi:hypothetical protein